MTSDNFWLKPALIPCHVPPLLRSPRRDEDSLIKTSALSWLFSGTIKGINNDGQYRVLCIPPVVLDECYMLCVCIYTALYSFPHWLLLFSFFILRWDTGKKWPSLLFKNNMYVWLQTTDRCLHWTQFLMGKKLCPRIRERSKMKYLKLLWNFWRS